MSLTIPGYIIQPISGRLFGRNDLSGEDIAKLHLRGLTETWQFGLTDIARALWAKVCANKWKVVETGNSFSNHFPYGSNNGTSLIVFFDLKNIH